MRAFCVVSFYKYIFSVILVKLEQLFARRRPWAALGARGLSLGAAGLPLGRPLGIPLIAWVEASGFRVPSQVEVEGSG